MDPISELSGVQKRLQNLGLYQGEAHGDLDEPTGAAISEFQRRHDLDPTGAPDEDTLAQLARVHDSTHLPDDESSTETRESR